MKLRRVSPCEDVRVSLGTEKLVLESEKDEFECSETLGLHVLSLPFGAHFERAPTAPRKKTKKKTKRSKA